MIDLPAIRERAEKYLRTTAEMGESGAHFTGCGHFNGRDCSCGWDAIKEYVASLEARLREVEAGSQKLRLLAEGLAVEVEAERGRRDAPKGGQQVPNFGDFANMPISAFQRLEWWARGIRKILAGEEW